MGLLGLFSRQELEGFKDTLSASTLDADDVTGFMQAVVAKYEHHHAPRYRWIEPLHFYTWQINQYFGTKLLKADILPCTLKEHDVFRTTESMTLSLPKLLLLREGEDESERRSKYKVLKEGTYAQLFENLEPLQRTHAVPQPRIEYMPCEDLVRRIQTYRKPQMRVFGQHAEDKLVMHIRQTYFTPWLKQVRQKPLW
jgi:hypothetical protein